MLSRTINASRVRSRLSCYWRDVGTVLTFRTVAYRGSDAVILGVAINLVFLGVYGGDDGARTRDLCRDRAQESGNL